MTDVVNRLLTADEVAERIRRALGDQRMSSAAVDELERQLVAGGGRLLTADEVATILRVSRRYVLRLARDGALERVKRPGGKVVLFWEDKVLAYLEQGRQVPVRVGSAAARILDEPQLPAVGVCRRERLR